MVKQFTNFSDRPKLKSLEIFTGGSVNLIFMDYIENWSLIRKIVSSSVTKTKIISNYKNVFGNQTKILIDSMKSYSKINEPFNSKKYFDKLLINIVSGIMFKPEEKQTINDNIENDPISKLAEPIQQVFLLLGYTPFFKYEYEKLKVCMDKVFKFTEEIYEHHLAKFDKSNQRDIMDCFIDYEFTNSPNSTPEEKRMRITKSCMAFIFAGDDSVASTLEWTCLYLINNPNIQEKCYNEIISVLGNNQNKKFISFKEKDNCKYLTNAIKESCEINGYFIEKDTQILTNVFGMGHLYAEEPNLFNPDRWVQYYNQKQQQQINQQQTNNYFNDLDRVCLPFSTGPRNCEGLSIAELIIFSAIANIILNSQMESIDGNQLDETEVSGISIHPKPFSIKLVERN
ncbi:hypothetical protein ACTFIZ_008805 [Dictyostelium cf. discoideum]